MEPVVLHLVEEEEQYTVGRHFEEKDRNSGDCFEECFAPELGFGIEVRRDGKSPGMRNKRSGSPKIRRMKA